MQAVIGAIDANSLSAGYLEIYTTSYGALLCTITFQKPSFTESSGVISMTGAPKSGNATTNGTAAIARIRDGSANIVVSGLTVGTSSSDIILNSTSILIGQTVSLNSATITHSP
jgi:hypothetical protein